MVVGAGITVAVELVFAAIYPADLIQEGLSDRLLVVYEFLKNAREPSDDIKKKLAQYADIGTGYLRRLLARSEGGQEDNVRKTVQVVLTGRLVDLSAGFLASGASVAETEQARLAELAGRIDQIRKFGALSNPRRDENAPLPSTGADFVRLLEATVQLLDDALRQPELVKDYLGKDEPARAGILKADAFINAAHLKFALRGTAAALVCYLAYHLLDWRGLYNSVATCMVTALSTTGSSRQKQLLRIAGAITGGLLLAISAEVFLLPHMDSITEFLLLFIAVTVFAAWFATASPRISYFGLQAAFAFYVVHLRTFGPDVQLTPARDNVAGILLGLLVMWIVFDQLAPHDTVVEMKISLVRGMRMVVEFMREHQTTSSRVQYLKRVRALRESINESFANVRNNADAVLLEFGSNRAQALKVRADVRAWQPLLRTLFMLQVTITQVRLREPSGGFSPQVENEQELCARILENTANVLERGAVVGVEADGSEIGPAQSASGEVDRSAAGSLADDSLDIARNLYGQVRAAFGG